MRVLRRRSEGGLAGLKHSPELIHHLRRELRPQIDCFHYLIHIELRGRLDQGRIEREPCHRSHERQHHSLLVRVDDFDFDISISAYSLKSV